MQADGQIGSEQTWSIRARRIALSSGLVVVSLLIWAIWELACTPYRPPQDPGTFFGGPELTFLFTLIAVLAIVWVVGAVRLALTFIPKSK